MAEQENPSKDEGFPRELLQQPIEARRRYFENKVIAHPLLRTAYERLLNTIRQPAGASLIWVYGPTGVGKTTLLKRVVKQLIEEAINDTNRNPGHIPVVSFGLQDVSIERGTFDWKDFFKCLLRVQNEPLIEHKMDYDDLANLKRSSNRAITVSDLRYAARQCLHYRQPKTVMIDEAQHFKKVAGGKRFIDQMDIIKAFAETTGILHTLVGTYELLELPYLSGQLSRRGTQIHLPRYRCENEKDLEAFKNMLIMFQMHLPLLKEPNLVDKYEYFYDGCVGCIGVLKDWLRRALEEAMEKGEKTLTKECLKRHAKSTHELMNMIREISRGEQSLKETPQDRTELRKLLGWDKVSKKQKEPKEQETGESPSDKGEQELKDQQPAHPEEREAKPKQTRKRVGQRDQKRDPVGSNQGKEN